MKKISILGSTGSIGQNALNIVEMHRDKLNVTALAGGNNISLLAEQIKKFKPEIAVVLNEKRAKEIETLLKGDRKTEIVFGDKGYAAAAAWDEADIVLLAIVGAAGLLPAIAAIDAGKTIALANKETLVMAGDIIMARAKKNKVDIFPVDSEHSAIFQCIEGNRKKDIKKIFLTASGGPFRNKTIEDFKNIRPEHALSHPTWNMGNKITIDSATMMNKGFEVIEAVHLFGLDYCDIEVLVHPESIVHSMVGFKDGSVIAQMGVPDMKIAISYALLWPERLFSGLDFPDFTSIKRLCFEKPDTIKFPCLKFAFEACRHGGTLPAVMNAANEIAVNGFLEYRLDFPGIFRIINKCMELHKTINSPELSDILEADLWARQQAENLISSYNRHEADPDWPRFTSKNQRF